MKYKIPLHLKNTIYEIIPQEMKILYGSLIGNSAKDYRVFYEGILSDLLETPSRDKILKMKRKNQTLWINTKRRWVKMVEDEFDPDRKNKPKYLKKEYDYLLIAKENELLMEELDDPDERKKSILSLLNVWKEDTSKYVYEFYYLKNHTKNQIKTAFRIDTHKIILDYIYEHYDGNPRHFTSIIPQNIVHARVFGLPQTVVIDDVRSDGMINSYTDDNGTTTSVHIDKSKLVNEDKNTIVMFDHIDRKIYDYALANMDYSSLQRTFRLSFDINRCTKYVYTNTHKKNVQQIEKRLLRFDSFYFIIRNDEDEQKNIESNNISHQASQDDKTVISFERYQPFAGARIIKEGKNRIGEILLSKPTVDELLKNNVYVLYRRVLDSLDFPSNDKILPSLVQVIHVYRLKYFSKKIHDDTYVWDDKGESDIKVAAFKDTLDKSSFERLIRLNKTSWSRIHQKIITVLDRMILNDIYICDYRIESGKFILYYSPLTEDEISDYPTVNDTHIADIVYDLKASDTE